jgi:hypothetical protein
MAKTGVRKTTPTTAIDVLLGLPPLHVMTETEAQEIYRLNVYPTVET